MDDGKDMLVLKGAHGTCVSAAMNIDKHGFKPPTTIGRAGKGIYFWAHGELHTDLAKKLAIGWYTYANRAGIYNEYLNKNGAVLWVEIQVDEDAYIDFNAQDVEDVLNYLMAQAREGCKENEPIDDQILHKVHEDLILRLEEKLGHKIDVIRAKVAPPRMSFIEKIYVGNPNCYIIRNQFERIKLVRTEYL